MCDFLLVITSCLAPFPSYGSLLVKFSLATVDHFTLTSSLGVIPCECPDELYLSRNYHVSQKTAPFYFCNNFVKQSSILTICGTLVPRLLYKVESRESAYVSTEQRASTACAHNR